MASTLTTYAALLKTRYTEKKVEDLTMADRPFQAMMQKNTDFSGDGHKIPMIYVNPQGVAASTRAQAQTSATNLASKFFLLTTGKEHGSVEIGDEVIKASRNNPGAFLQNKTAEIDGLYEQVADTLAIHLAGNGGGALARRLSASSNTITVYDAQTLFAIEVGMRVSFSTADGDAAADALKAGDTFVTAVDHEAGTFTVDDITDVTSPANDDYIFRTGDFAGNTTTKLVKGVQAYLPATHSSIPNLFSMVRTDNPSRLGGVLVPSAELTGLNMEQRIRKLGTIMNSRHKVKGYSHGFMNPEDWEQLSIALQAKGTRPIKDDTTRFGFMALEMVTAGKVVRIFADRYFPKGTYFGLNLSNWTLMSMGELISPISADGLTILRKAATDDYEYRLISYPQLANNAPGFSGRVPVS